MAKYIDAEALKELFADSAALCNDIDEFPAADVRENRHGRWIETDSHEPCWFKCDQCGRLSDIKEIYCPTCGASMANTTCGADMRQGEQE